MVASRLWHLRAILCLATALAAMALHSEEDFAFDMTAAEEQEVLSGPISRPHLHSTSSPVQRLWGIPDTVAPVSKLFHMTIPEDAFSGAVYHYEVNCVSEQGDTSLE